MGIKKTFILKLIMYLAPVLFILTHNTSNSKEPTSNSKNCNSYKTKEGESLIEILRKKSMTPIYGTDGSLNKTRQLNPSLPINNPTFKGGEIICLIDSKNKEEQIYSKDATEVPNFHMIYIEGGSRYLRLIDVDTADNTSATLLSRIILSTEMGLIQKWHSKFQSYFGINYAISEIMQSNTAVIIGESIIRLTNFIAGVKYNFLPYAYGQMEFGYGDILLFRAQDNTTIQMEKMSTAKLKFIGGLTMYEYGSFGFHGELAFLLNTPFENEIYNSQSGKGYEGALLSTYQGTGWDLRLRLYYSAHETTIPPVIFDYTEVGVLIRLAVDLEN